MKKGEEKEIVKRAYLFLNIFFFVVPLSPVKWGSRWVALYLCIELDEFSDFFFSVYGHCLVIFEKSLDCFFRMCIVAVTPIAEAIANISMRNE
jgi:hypothetical protein